MPPDTHEFHLYQDLNINLLTNSEKSFLKDLQERSLYKIDEIYQIFFDYKTQQLTFALQNIIQDEQSISEKYRSVLEAKTNKVKKGKAK